MSESTNRKVLGTLMLSIISLVSLYLIFTMSGSMLAAQFGISNYAAKKIINIASGAGSVTAIIAVVGGTAGWGVAILAGAKWALKHYGKAAAW